MNIVDELGRTADEAKRLQLVGDYWNGLIGAKPIIEVMVASAQVIEEIVLSREERRTLWADHGLTRFDHTKASDADYPFLDTKGTRPSRAITVRKQAGGAPHLGYDARSTDPVCWALESHRVPSGRPLP